MSYRLSTRSIRTLSTVKPEMQAVVRRAIELTEVDFMVVQGKRTWDEQAKLYGQGRTATALILLGIPASYAQPHKPKVTWTMKSNHLSGDAVDLVAWVNGAISWDTTKGYYEKIAVAMKQAAMELCTVIEWGGDWNTTKDYPHFELAG